MTARKQVPVSESEVVLALFRAADRLRRHFTEVLAKHELTLPQYNVLRILRGAGGPLPTMEIRARMMERAPGITRIVDGLAEKGLVERELPERDRRQVLCGLTRPGRELLERLDPDMDFADRVALRDLEGRRRTNLAEALRAIEQNVPD